MKEPYEECPSFGACSAPKCPLDPQIHMRIRLAGEDKCKANKPTRERIGKKYADVLKYQGLTKREWDGRKRWDMLGPVKQKLFATQGAKQLKMLKLGHLGGNDG